MSDEERSGKRSLLYSGWHRTASTARFIGRVSAAKLCMIDVDACEYCCYCHEPVALIETQESANAPKRAPVTAALARMAGIPAYSVSVAPSALMDDVLHFQVQQIAPPSRSVTPMWPAEYAHWLLLLRDQHVCSIAGAA